MKIKLSDDVSMDLDKAIESRVLIQANSGGGKSFTARRFIEQAFGKKQIIIMDPEGEFGNLREEFDFVYIAKDGGDATAEVRSAALLARRLLETKADAIIDIYELGSERGAFVKAFYDACVNMPKNLWQDCFFPLDEAHKFAPEKGQGESVALQSVIDMASLGRKRGYCLIPMTQRPSKLSKDVVAECNNKLIGRASLDIDRERSAKELGFRTKEDILSLRDLEPGEFYVFGPAISRDVVKTKIGDVKIKPPKRGVHANRVPPPTAKVKKLLAELADLPEAAAKEATTIAELKAENTLLRRQNQQRIIQNDTKEAEKAVITAVTRRDKEWKHVFDTAQKTVETLTDRLMKISHLAYMEVKLVEAPKTMTSDGVSPAGGLRVQTPAPARHKVERPHQGSSLPSDVPQGDISNPQQRILNALVWLEWAGIRSAPRAQVAALAEQSPKSSGYTNNLSALKTAQLIDYSAPGMLSLTETGRKMAVAPEKNLTGEEVQKRVEKLVSNPQWRIINALIAANPGDLSREDVAERSGQSAASSGFTNNLSALKTFGFLEYSRPGYVKAAEILFI
jgi:hypothetical protein